MARVRRNRSPNADLVEAAENCLPNILMFYKRFEEKRPVMLLDLQSQKIYAYPYKEFKAELSERSQAGLTHHFSGLTHHNSELRITGKPCLLVKPKLLDHIFATFR